MRKMKRYLGPEKKRSREQSLAEGNSSVGTCWTCGKKDLGSSAEQEGVREQNKETARSSSLTACICGISCLCLFTILERSRCCELGLPQRTKGRTSLSLDQNDNSSALTYTTTEFPLFPLKIGFGSENVWNELSKRYVTKIVVVLGGLGAGKNPWEMNPRVLSLSKSLRLERAEQMKQILSGCVLFDMSTAMSRTPVPQTYGSGQAFSCWGWREFWVQMLTVYVEPINLNFFLQDNCSPRLLSYGDFQQKLVKPAFLFSVYNKSTSSIQT